MRALQLIDFQRGPELREVPDPEAGPGQVVIRVGGAGACHSDLHLIHDFAPGMMPWKVPFTLGHENAGWVDQIGAGVSGLEVGQPVAVYGPWGCGACARCSVGIETYCDRKAAIPAAGGGLGLDGGMAEKMLIPSPRFLVPLGELAPAAAAPLTDAALTPYHAIKRSLHRCVPGANVVVIGIGGLGHMAVQILAAMTAATVIAVDARAESLDLARSTGATHAVAAGPEAAAQIRDLTKGLGADLVIDLVGSNDTIALGMSVSRPMGCVTIVGIGGGSYPMGFFTSPYEVELITTYWGSRPELAEVLALAEAGHIHAHATQFPLDRAAEAYELLHQGKVQGRAVIVP